MLSIEIKRLTIGNTSESALQIRARIGGVRNHINNRRLAGLDRPQHSRSDTRRIRHLLAATAERLRYEIEPDVAKEGCDDTVAAELKSLKICLDPLRGIVRNNDDDRQLVSNGSVKFHQMKPHCSISSDAHRWSVRPGELVALANGMPTPRQPKGSGSRNCSG